MKSKLIAALALALMSAATTALAAGNEKFKDGTYGSYTKVCGIHLEHDGDKMILTYTPNPMTGNDCGPSGETYLMDCTPEGSCSYTVTESSVDDTDTAKTVISHRVTQDGNVLRTWETFNRKGKLLNSNLTKFIWWRTW